MKKIYFKNVGYARRILAEVGLMEDKTGFVIPINPPEGYLFICPNMGVPLEIGTLNQDDTLELYNEDAPFVKGYHKKLLEEVSGVKYVKGVVVV